MISKNKLNFSYIYLGIIVIITLSFVIGYVYTLNRAINRELASKIESYEANKENNLTDDTEKIDYTINQDNNKKKLITKIHYTICGHVLLNESDMPDDIVGLTHTQFEFSHSDWAIDKFEDDEIVISKLVNEKCPNHYILREKDEKIAVFYQQGIDGSLLREITNISVYSLSVLDQQRLRNGIVVDSNEELAEILEDFDS